MLILLTGATGYIGGRLLRALQDSGHRVRCLARRPEFLREKLSADAEVARGDVLDKASLTDPLRDVDTAYYLVHSLASDKSFEDEDRQGARNFAEAAREAGLRRIIYLGGLGTPEADLSPHLRSRLETGEILRSTGVPVIELRASIVIGSGSLSFEIVRALTERLPAMITPRWVRTLTQPIAIEDLIQYLVQALDLPGEENRIFEIGGADQVSYGDIMREYARQRGLRRLLIPVPVLTPRLSSLWLALVTPAHARAGRPLIQGVRNATVVQDDSALRTFRVRPMSVAEAVRRALLNEEREFAETRWSDALSAARGHRSWGGTRFGARLVDSRTATVACSPAAAFAPIRRLGGNTGWYYANWLWRLRGRMDSLVGGVGHRRGRRDPETFRVGDTLDFWRVEVFEPDRRLRMIAEMRLPGRAWLEFSVDGDESCSVIRQTAIFDPVGLAGLGYWYFMYPAHALLFKGMLREIARAAEAEWRASRNQSGGDAPKAFDSPAASNSSSKR